MTRSQYQGYYILINVKWINLCKAVSLCFGLCHKSDFIAVAYYCSSLPTLPFLSGKIDIYEHNYESCMFMSWQEEFVE